MFDCKACLRKKGKKPSDEEDLGPSSFVEVVPGAELERIKLLRPKQNEDNVDREAKDARKQVQDPDRRDQNIYFFGELPGEIIEEFVQYYDVKNVQRSSHS